MIAVAGVVLAFGVGVSVYYWLQPAPVARFLSVSGNIEAHESLLSFNVVQSRIVDLPFDEGEWVKRGTLIARVDDADYRQRVRIADAAVLVQQRSFASAGRNAAAARQVLVSDRAALAYKRVNYVRLRRLVPTGAASRDALDLARAALQESAADLQRDQALLAVARRNVALAHATVRNAEASLKLARIIEGYTTLRAPFNGVIMVRQAELGEVVGPGTPIVTLGDLDHVWMRAYVNEPDLGRVHLGEAAIVTTDNRPAERFRGRVSFIAQNAEFTPKTVDTYAERVTLVYRIRIDIDNRHHELVPGMPVNARIELARDPSR